jgi:uroporphyrinogen-III synthase
MRLIVTRPEPDATRTAEALIRLGHEPILSPMLDIEPVRPQVLPEGDFQAALVTTANAVRILAGHPQRSRLAALPFFAVGDRTALEARRAGFAARSAGGDASDLAALVANACRPADGALLYVAGRSTARDLAGQLASLGFTVETAIVYSAAMRARLAGVAAAALRAGTVDGVLFYSARTAQAFAAAAKADGLTPLSPAITLFCLSPACAAPLAEIAEGQVAVATRPDQLNLFAEIERVAATAR